MRLAAMIVPPLALFLAQCSSENAHGVQKQRDDSTASHAESGVPQTVDTILPRSRKVYEIAVGNSDSSFIGYEGSSEATGFGSGPGAIDIWEKYAFIADTYHNNIKRLDLETGEVITSPRFLSPDAPPVQDVAVKDGSVYVLNMSDTLYRLDKDLNLERKVPLLERFWRTSQNFLHRWNQPVEIYVSPFMMATLLPSGIKYDSSEHDRGHQEIRDQQDRLWAYRKIALSSNTDSTRWYAQLPNGAFLQLEEPLQQMDLWWAMNTAVDSTRFAYFYAAPKEFKVHVYTF